MQITSSLSVTVYVEDINDHAPIFVGAPYHVTVDELTPVGKLNLLCFSYTWPENKQLTIVAT